MILTNLFLNRLRRVRFERFHQSYEEGSRGRLGNILHLPVGYSCNNNCLHCPYKNKRRLNRTTEEYMELLRVNRKKKNLLIISGGEPTIRRDIFELISYARRLSYEWIQFKSNGRLFKHKNFTDNIIKAIQKNPVSQDYRNSDNPLGYNFGNLGIFEFVIKLNGHTKELHDSITKSAGSFEQTIQGIKNIIELKQNVVINIEITKENYKFLPKISKYASSLGVNQIEFDFPMKNMSMAPKLSDLMPIINKTLGQSKINITANIPYCNIREYEWRHSEIYYPYDQHEMYEIIDFDGAYSYYDIQIKNKTKGKKCYSCIYDPICSGFWKRYIEMYGDEELKPILEKNPDRTQFKYLKSLNKLRLTDLSLDFEDQNLKFEFNKIKADVAACFSGGVDSTLAAELFAKENKDSKIVLITYDNIPPPIDKNSILTGEYLLKKYKNIINHFVINIPPVLSKKFIFEGLEENYKKYGSYTTCVACKTLRMVYTIYLLKKYFKGSMIITGLKKEGNPGFEKILEDWVNQYSIKIANPLRKVGKRDVIKLALERKMPIPKPKNQARCWTNLIKTRLKNPNKKWGAYIEKILKISGILLEKEGILPKNLK